MANFKLGCSIISGTIYAGNVLKNGTWGSKKHDVTDSAVAAVAQHLLHRGEMMEFKYADGNTYVLKVEKVND
jgi:hypothetical protein